MKRSQGLTALAVLLTMVALEAAVIWAFFKPWQDANDAYQQKIAANETNINKTRMLNAQLVADNRQISAAMNGLTERMVANVAQAQINVIDWANEAGLKSLLIDPSVNSKQRDYDQGIIAYHLLGNARQYTAFQKRLHEAKFIAYIDQEHLSKNGAGQFVIKGQMVFLMAKQ